MTFPSEHIALEGKFVRLEPLTLRHLPQLELGFDPSLFDFYPQPYGTAREFVAENLDMEKRGERRPYAIVLQATGEAIGCTEFSSFDFVHRKIEIGGTWLKNAFHGTAANPESKLLLLTHAFEVWQCLRVQFKTDSLNKRSQKALEKIGATLEGMLRNAKLRPDGRRRHDVYYSVIEEEWLQVKAALQRLVTNRIRV